MPIDKRKEFMKRSLSFVFLLAIFVVFLVSLTLPLLNKQAPSIGDWGNYVGGVAGAATLIWLVVGHLQNQAELRESKEELGEQLELTRDVAGTLATLASRSQPQAAEILTNAEPQFECCGSMIQPTPGNPFIRKSSASQGHIELLNVGGPITNVTVQSHCDYDATYQGPITLNSGRKCKLDITSTKAVTDSGPIRLVIHGKDKFERGVWSEITAPSFDGPFKIRGDLGQGPNGNEPKPSL